MASQGPNGAGAGGQSGSATGAAFVNPGNITASDNTYASAGTQAGGGGFNSDYLEATSFGFAIPSGATIDGIVVEWERKADATNTLVGDLEIKIIKGGTIGSTNKAIGGSWSTTESYVSYGGAADLWGTTWTDSDINASNFGCAMKVTGTGSFPWDNGTALVDHVRITVYYTGGGASGSKVPHRRRRFFTNRKAA